MIEMRPRLKKKEKRAVWKRDDNFAVVGEGKILRPGRLVGRREKETEVVNKRDICSPLLISGKRLFHNVRGPGNLQRE